jgi:HEAT repeat protein
MMMADDASATVRLEAVQSLVLLGPPAATVADYAAAVGPTILAVQDRQKVEKDKSVQIWLIMLLMRLDGNELNPTNVGKISALINAPEPTVRAHALSALGLLGEKARPAIPAMIDALKMPEPVCVAAAISALSALGENARTAITELEKIKAGKDETLKKMAEDAIDVISGKKKK